MPPKNNLGPSIRLISRLVTNACTHNTLSASYVVVPPTHTGYVYNCPLLCIYYAQVDKGQFDKVMGYIKTGKAEGATCVTGGQRHGDTGYFVEPTVFTDVTDDMTIMKEEIFGPVMCIAKFTRAYADTAAARTLPPHPNPNFPTPPPRHSAPTPHPP